MNRKCIIFVSILAMHIYACEKIDPYPYIDQAIFPGTEYIFVPEYSYTDPDTNREYTIHGTSGDSTIYQSSSYGILPSEIIVHNIADTVSNRPSFTWTRTESQYVMVAVFNTRIMVHKQDQRISNIQSIVWCWNSGMPTGNLNLVSYMDGCNVSDGEIQYDTPPEPLASGVKYHFAIWAWDNKAEKVTHSSREIPFFVEHPDH